MLTTSEVARWCEVDTATVRRWQKGILGGHIGYERHAKLPEKPSVRDLLEFLAAADGASSLRHEPLIMKGARNYRARQLAAQRAGTPPPTRAFR